ncbi:MAG: hypothetical protein ACI9WU_004823 [Myxococcota bacterium]|jgi:hypothetical protein
MANCCGGKNAGKEIGVGRFMAGMSVFLGYHGAMRVLLSTASVPIPALKKVRDFHRAVFEQDLKEILALEDINLNNRLGDPEVQGAVCAADFTDGVRTVALDDVAAMPVAVPRLEVVPDPVMAVG